ncbi:hypothetical protein C2G38_2202635 [Gigaspora rosea]|uniref:BED-type domain-containing protein n=1 Tax=Gigaspora rosea TaxID=44941 RepID=A0A397URB9_9GLOM|nr:hypothetical protein C2G38_2202635 [Gigaspora rosea]
MPPQTCDIGPQENSEFSSTAVRKKTAEEPKKQKKIQVNITKQADKKLLSYVWDYFEVKNGCGICKIVVLKKGIENICGTDYKHDSGTSNMKFHLQTMHRILGPNDINPNPTEWLVMDSLLFNIVHKEGNKKMINRFDPAFKLPNSKSIKEQLTIAYHKSILELKEFKTSPSEADDDDRSEMSKTKFKVLCTISENNVGVKKDSNKLNRLMLKDNEWALLQELIDVFKPFDELTIYFSSIKYSILLAINPIIEILKLNLLITVCQHQMNLRIPNIEGESSENESFENEDDNYSSDNTNTQQPLSNRIIILQV